MLDDLGDSNYDRAPEYITQTTRRKAIELRADRQQLNLKRHELIVSLRSINLLEKQLVEAEWMTWLGEELYRCDLAAHMLAAATEDEIMKHRNDIYKLKQYCEDCRTIWGNVRDGLKEL